MSPFATRSPPYSSTAPVATLPTRVIPGEYTAISRIERRVAAALRAFSVEKISSLRRSRRNACTARMPPNVSTNAMITSAIASRLRR